MKNLLKNMKIRTRIFLLLGLTLTSMSLVTAVGLWQVNAIGRDITTLTKLNVPLTEVLSKITFNSMEQRIHFERAVQYGRAMAQDMVAKDNFETERKSFLEHGQVITQEIAKGGGLLEQLLEVHRASYAQEKAVKIDYELRNISKEHSDYQFAAKRVLNLLAQGRGEQAQATIEKIEEIHRRGEQRSPLENLLLAIEDFIRDTTAHAQTNKQTAIIGMLLFSALILTFGLGIGIFVSRGISEPLQLAVNIATRIAAGDRDITINTTARDETGQLLKTMKEMSYSIKGKEESLQTANQRLRASQQELENTNQQLKSEVIERKKAEEATHHSEQRYRAIFRQAVDSIVLIDAETGELVEFNDRACENLGFTREEFQKLKIPDFEALQSKEEVEKHIEIIIREGSEVFETKHRTKDGEIRDIRVSSSSISLEGKDYCQSIWSDITEQKQAEEELKETHKRLIESSRQAGMAEVATDVLHNVGNVLNSVNVSTTLIREVFSNSKVANLKKAADMIEEHSGDLGAFLTEDPKGKHIPSYLIQTAELLANEQEDVVKKLHSLAEDVGHIKDIVKMQQAYAKVSGVEINTGIEQLIEDAIRINQSGLERHGIRIVRQYAELGDVSIDKQRVIQILVNLIGNAKYALSNSERTDKTLTIKFYQHNDDCLRIEVADNGVGIAKENITQIFRHGFTTKKNGHGFGLHSGAIAAKEIEGSLTVYSDGPGHGATFTLELPFKPVRV